MTIRLHLTRQPPAGPFQDDAPPLEGPHVPICSPERVWCRAVVDALDSGNEVEQFSSIRLSHQSLNGTVADLREVRFDDITAGFVVEVCNDRLGVKDVRG